MTKKKRPKKEVELRGAVAVLAANIRLLTGRDENKNIPAKVSAAAVRLGFAVSARTVQNMKDGTYNPLAKLEAVARAFGLEPWQILYPQTDALALELLRVYAATSDTGRELIDLAVKGAKAEIDRQEGAEGPR